MTTIIGNQRGSGAAGFLWWKTSANYIIKSGSPTGSLLGLFSVSYWHMCEGGEKWVSLCYWSSSNQLLLVSFNKISLQQNVSETHDVTWILYHQDASLPFWYALQLCPLICWLNILVFGYNKGFCIFVRQEQGVKWHRAAKAEMFYQVVLHFMREMLLGQNISLNIIYGFLSCAILHPELVKLTNYSSLQNISIMANHYIKIIGKLVLLTVVIFCLCG